MSLKRIVVFLAALLAATSIRAAAARVEGVASARAAYAPAPPTIDASPALVRDFTLAVTGTLDSANTDSITVYRASAADTAVFGMHIEASKTFAKAITLREGDNEIWAVALDASGNPSPRSNTVIVRYETIIARIYPEVFRGPDVFEIDLTERAYEATVDIYTVSGEHIVRLRTSGAATQFRIEWNLESGDGLPVRNGAYLAVFTVALAAGTTTVEKQFIAVVR